MSSTSLLGKPPEITAPVKLAGESDSDMLFKWLVVKNYLWMLASQFDDELRRIVKSGVSLELVYRLEEWKRDNAEWHKALTAPEDLGTQKAAFDHLRRLIEAHFFELGGSENE